MNDYRKNKLNLLVLKLWDNTIKYKEQRLLLRRKEIQKYQRKIQNRIKSLNINGVCQFGNGFYNCDDYGFTIATNINSKRLCLFPSISNTGLYLDKVTLESLDVFVVSFFELIPLWVSELSKKEMLTSLSHTSFELCIEEVMKELNLKYSLHKETSKVILKVTLKAGIELEIPLLYHNIQLTLLNINNLIEQFTQLQNTKIPIKIIQSFRNEYFAPN